MVFNAFFNNISVISWRSVLLVEKTGIPRENDRSAIPFSKFPVSRRLLKLFYDENTQFFYLLCSQFLRASNIWEYASPGLVRWSKIF
jgi:hypothetical protein